MPVPQRRCTFNVRPIHSSIKAGPLDRILSRPQPPHASPFVNDTIEVLLDIWPTSLAVQQQQLTFFTMEVLRRCQFSKQLLETALYFLVKIKPHVEDSRDPVLRCPRKSFLAALILAGKYAQDRPFSLQAWAKISGLDARSLVANELVFLKTVNWDLFIPAHGIDSLRLHIHSVKRRNYIVTPAVSDSPPELIDDEGSPTSDSE